MKKQNDLLDPCVAKKKDYISPVEFLVHLQKIYIETSYIPLEILESEDLENQNGQFCKAGQDILQT